MVFPAPSSASVGLVHVVVPERWQSAQAGLTSSRCDKCLVVVLIECACAVASLASDMCALALRRCAVCWSEPTTPSVTQ